MRVFTVMGPSQAGKTTLVRAMAGLDGDAGQKQEAAGVVTLQPFSFMEEDWAALEVTGGAENLAQAGPALAASDAAVVCVPSDPNQAVLAAPYLRKVEEAGLPVFLFINRMDQARERVADILSGLQTYCAHNLVLRQVPMRREGQVVGAVDLISERAWQYQDGKPSALVKVPTEMQAREQAARADLLEVMADFDDALLEELVEDHEILAADAYDVARKLLQHSDVIPVFLGMAEQCNGVMRLMKSLRHEAPSVEQTLERISPNGNVVAVGCLAQSVKHLGKSVVLRAMGAPCSSGSAVAGEALGGLSMVARGGNGTLMSGDLGKVVKSDHLNMGYAYLRDGARALPDWAQPRPATYRRLITPMHRRDETRLSAALVRLGEVDPAMQVAQDEATGQTMLNLQGPQHLRRVMGSLQDEFGIEVEAENVPPALRETITKPVEIHHRHRKQSGGAGQFADVVMQIKPMPRGNGVSFEECVKGGAVPKNYIPAVEVGAREALQQGLNGHPIVDVAITLKDGKHHSVDSSDFAFRTAGKNAMREALAEAGVVLLQPIVKVAIHVPSVFSGALVPVVSGMKGQILGFESEDGVAGWDLFETLLPMAAQDELCSALASATRGTAWFDSGFDHYEEAHGR
ncbi:elongation factor G [Epibacterium sp. SM1969]|uniref:Elongation factor G n=1 Tax=Tritonibacter aquimaris TaxID=2663379 RepID=A0A844AL35_9RHOB|nr:elongation factor G [Tritonibacter aquimaris]MQY42139.1 elongation factor G [Tritonibacter aquimaris]